MLTTHFHHPLDRYMSALEGVGLPVTKMRELSGRGFKFPRFLLLISRAV